MASGSSEDKKVPSWNGDPAKFLTYQDDVRWYVRRLKVEDRKVAAARLVGNLHEGARDVAIKWDPSHFEKEDGAQKLLDKFKKTPLVRQTLPSAVSSFNRYFELQRRLGTSMGRFLVLEGKLHDEFRQAVDTLYDESLNKLDDTYEEEEENDVISKEDFILELLRGWRLLDATGLDVKERQAIMASTGNRMDYTSVMNALRSQWGEEKDLAQRDQVRRRHTQTAHAAVAHAIGTEPEALEAAMAAVEEGPEAVLMAAESSAH